ncbi:MAG: hypothetical protein KC493_17545, partial [Bacteriovoracaceae bacterium]|nr:hypothetical protein [Bacteriovoracaceae bacterium]
ETEFKSLKELEDQFQSGTKLFSYSNSVTTNKNGSGHGWIGIRFQVDPTEDPIDVLIHANFAKSPVLTQHKEVGKMGVNLIHGAVTPQKYSPDNILVSLLDQLKKGSLDIDYIDFSKGSLNSSKSALELVKNGLTKNVLLDNSESYVPKDLFYKKALYVGVDSQNLSELDSIAIKQTDSTSSTVTRSLQDGKKVWITKETDLFKKFSFLDQGMGLEVFYKISHQELNELSDSNLKGFIRKLGSLNNSFKFSFQDDPSLLKPEAKSLLSRLAEKELLID